MQEIKLTLTVDEINKILEGLGQMPYQNVYSIINKIQMQAESQLNESAEENPGKD